MTKNRKVQSALTAAALATLISLGAGSAVAAESPRSAISNNDRGTSVSLEQGEQKRKSSTSQSAKIKKQEKERSGRKEAPRKKLTPEAVQLLKEYRGEHREIMGTFRTESKAAKEAFKLVVENEFATEAEIAEAETLKKAAMKAIHLKRKASLKSLKSQYEKLFHDLDMRLPKL